MVHKTRASLPRLAATIEHWDAETDVLIVGLGGAGASAAIAAADAGAQVLVVEAASVGGDTPTQKACCIEDTLEDMYQYLMLTCGPNADQARVRDYVDNNLAHFDWLVEQGVEFSPVFETRKLNDTHGDEGLTYSGNEACYPYDELARSAPRGHRGKAIGVAVPAHRFDLDVLWSF